MALINIEFKSLSGVKITIEGFENYDIPDDDIVKGILMAQKPHKLTDKTGITHYITSDFARNTIITIHHPKE